MCRPWVFQFVVIWLFSAVVGCSTMKESFTARTGIEQLLISSATDKALDKIDFRPVAQAKVFVETKYLDCTDKNYIIVALHQHLLKQGCMLVDKAEDSQVIVEIASGSVGTDGSETYLGSPDIPLPPPSPIMIPKVPLFQRKRTMGTAKLAIVAYDTSTKASVINSGYVLARTDYRNLNFMGAGAYNSGSVHQELARNTREVDSISDVGTVFASKSSNSKR